MIEKGVLDKQADKHKQKRKGQIQVLETQEHQPQNPACEYEMQNAEDDPCKGKNNVAAQGDKSGRKSQDRLPANECDRPKPVFGGYVEARPHCQNKAGHDQRTEFQPEGIGLKTEARDSEIVEIEAKMVHEHQHDGCPPKQVQERLAGWSENVGAVHDDMTSLGRAQPVHRSTSIGKTWIQAVFGVIALSGALFLLLGACSPMHKHDEPGPGRVHFLTPEMPFGPTTPLPVFLNQALEDQYPSKLPPFLPPKPLEEHFIELDLEPPRIHLATGVRSYSAGTSGLAAGLEDGNIMIWSDWPCPALSLPESSPVDMLAWDGASAFLGASGTQRFALHVYDLRLCGHVGSITSDKPVSVAAVSPSGKRIALVDNTRRLHVGEAGLDELRQGEMLRFPPLALSFTPREGLLFSVDQAGWLLHWKVPELQVLHQSLIPGGPFRQAFFDGRQLFLEPLQRDTIGSLEDGREWVAWDIPISKVVSVENIPARIFDLKSGLLTYQTSDRRWIRKLRLGRPSFHAWASPSAGRLRIKDVDGSVGCFSAWDGLPEHEDECHAADWKKLEVDRSGSFHWGGVSYALGDPIRVRQEHVLYCRHLPENRFFLWWDDVKRDEQHEGVLSSPHAGFLPVRKSLRKEIPPTWIPLPFPIDEFLGASQ